ncbi:MAG: LLM class flavin-dependent oxidoreductase [Candidatus Bathyarchaeia archaeon]
MMPPVEGWIKYSRLAEKSGFDYLWLSADHVYIDSCSALAYAATKTKKIKLAPCANSIYLRHPVYIASATALIDEVSNGRAVAGLCSAGYETTVKLGIDAKEPLAICREAIEVIKALWKGKPVNYNGKFFHLKDVKLPYVMRTNIPIYLATRGSKFKLAGELCDGTFTHGKTLKYIERIIDSISEGAKRLERRPEDIEIGIVLPFMMASTQKSIETAKKVLKPLMTAFVGGEWTWEWADTLGFKMEELKPIREAVREYDFKKAQNFVSDELLDRMIEAYCITGSAEECISEVEMLKKAGVGQIIPIMQRKWEEPRRFIELFGKKIIQSFKE